MLLQNYLHRPWLTCNGCGDECKCATPVFDRRPQPEQRSNKVNDVHGSRPVCRGFATAACVIGLTLAASPAAQSDPGAAPSSPYPDANLIIRSYNEVLYSDYFTSSAGGVWFSTPLGLTCGIWDRGSFGCTGDIRGAPPGTTNIGWVNGNIVTRYDWLLGVQFPPGRAERDLPPRSYVTYNGTRCATMADSSTYCSRGPFKFFVTPNQTWLSPP
ncbi:hypothetical protein MycrhDRAFT_3682 [Mycolicibacterium rhodesiae JS60]|nr:hypothetical protein MycrhDRAFT_3682 [Mycolicibacterium rhodesiae JS60]